MPRLTKRTVEAAASTGRTTYIWDDQLAGFGVKLLQDGRRRYLVKYRVGGGRAARQRWLPLGIHGQVTCEQARASAVQALAAVARGEDPQDARLAERGAPTVLELWQRYDKEHLPRKKLQSSMDDRQKARDHILPLLGGRKVEGIRRADVQRLHQKLADRPYQANRVPALLSKMFNLAEVWGMRPDDSNPCRLIEHFEERKRQRYLNGAEMQRLEAAMREGETSGEITIYMAAAVRLLLLTGARVSEILSSRWEWVDWQRRVLQIPDSKTGPKQIFLSDQALRIMTSLLMSAGVEENPYIIRGRVKAERLVNLSKPWKRICTSANIKDARIHDLRHTSASVGVASGLNLPVVGRLLGHSQAQTTQRYAHVDVNPALAASNLVGDAISSMLSGTKR